MLLGTIAAARRRPLPAAVPLPFPLGGFGAVYDPYHLASMVTAGGSAPIGAGGAEIVGIIGSHGTNETRTTGGIIGNRLVLDQAGFGGVLNPLLTVKDGVQCWDMRDTTHDRALWGSCAGMDPRTALKGCVGAMLWLDYDVQGSPLCFNRNASGPGLGLAVPWDMYDDRANYPYGMFKIATSGVTQFMVAGRNDESSYKPADGRDRRLVRLHPAMGVRRRREQRDRPGQQLGQRRRDPGRDLGRPEDLGQQRRRRQLRPLHPWRPAGCRQQGPRLDELDRAHLLDRGFPRRQRDHRDDRLAAGHRLRQAGLRRAVHAGVPDERPRRQHRHRRPGRRPRLARSGQCRLGRADQRRRHPRRRRRHTTGTPAEARATASRARSTRCASRRARSPSSRCTATRSPSLSPASPTARRG